MRSERKERVLHARVPATLEEQIKRLAEGMRVPVSNVVRNLLQDAVEVTRRVSARDRLAEVYGWQALVLNLDAPCARCGALLGAGEQAHVGLSTHGRDPKLFICSACLPRKGDSDGRQT